MYHFKNGNEKSDQELRAPWGRKQQCRWKELDAKYTLGLELIALSDGVSVYYGKNGEINIAQGSEPGDLIRWGYCLSTYGTRR